ncbi:ROK family protein [Catenulispora acidiphila DSM 44928]|uniref:ROK family protein n=2 Tax=Catenulispora TaxID=414878 RepID=C7Q7U8_CATAD|nr:ROK family protein [Catenulispora acidiphila DSM 44928]
MIDHPDPVPYPGAMNSPAARPTPATSATVRELNLRTVWRVIGENAPISRAEISRATGISKPTVSAVLEDLLQIGLVVETADASRGFTYGAVFFKPRPEAAHAVAFDVGARHLRAALVGLDGTEVVRRDAEVEGRSAEEMVAAAVDLARELVEAAGVAPASVQHAVVGVPGVVDQRDGRVWQATNVPGMDGFTARERFSEALQIPVTVENDINLAAHGEYARGSGGTADSFLFLSIGTGVGAGLVLGGNLLRGFKGAAGELDSAFEPDIVEGPDGPEPEVPPMMDPCAQAILQYAAEKLPGELSDDQELTMERVFELARADDAAAQDVVREEARRIANYAAVASAVVDVELVVLGGGIGLNGDLLLTPVAERLAGRLPYPPRLETSALGSGAVLAGAEALAASLTVEQLIRDYFRA